MKQKYIVEDRYYTLLCKWQSPNGWKVISTIESVENELSIEVLEFELTKQEIENYDPRYMTFAISVGRN